MTLSDYKSGLNVDASSADWTYDASIQDSVLSIMLNVKNSDKSKDSKRLLEWVRCE